MREIERDELMRFSVRLQVAKRVVGVFLLLGMILHVVSALLFLGLREHVVTVTGRLYGVSASHLVLITLIYFAAVKCFFAGIVLPLWLSFVMAARWVNRKLVS